MDVCLDKQRKIFMLLKFDLAVLQINIKFVRTAWKLQLSQSSMQEIHSPLLLPCYFNYSGGNYSNDKSKIKLPLGKTKLF